MRISKFLFVLFGVLISQLAHAKPGCMLSPLQINDLATRTVKKYHQEKNYMPNSMIVRNSIDVDITNDDDDNTATDEQNLFVEGFWRPIADDFYQLGPAPLIGVDLQRGNNLVYVCAWRDGDPANEKVVVYFLHGYGLRRTGISNFFEEYIDGQYLKITPLHVDIVEIGQATSSLSRFFRKIPLLNALVGLPLEVVSDLEGDISQALSFFSGVGVERVTFTPGYLELANGVDLNDPEKTRTHVTIPIKKKADAPQ